MPSSALSTLVPVRKVTRERLLVRKGGATFDEAISLLLDATPALRPLPVSDEPVRRGPPPRLEPDGRRTPEKQLLLRELSVVAWAERLRRREIVEVGPRLFTWAPAPIADEGVRVDWPERRGFAP